MTVLRIGLICLSAALLSAMLKFTRPEMAMAISLAVSLLALMLTADVFQSVFGELELLIGLAGMDEANTQIVARAVGISIIAELGVQICEDAEQSALAGRIRLAARLTMLAMALPLAREIAQSLSSLW